MKLVSTFEAQKSWGPKSNPQCQAGRQWVPLLQSLVWLSWESSPQPTSPRVDALPLGYWAVYIHTIHTCHKMSVCKTAACHRDVTTFVEMDLKLKSQWLSHLKGCKSCSLHLTYCPLRASNCWVVVGWFNALITSTEAIRWVPFLQSLPVSKPTTNQYQHWHSTTKSQSFAKVKSKMPLDSSWSTFDVSVGAASCLFIIIQWWLIGSYRSHPSDLRSAVSLPPSSSVVKHRNIDCSFNLRL